MHPMSKVNAFILGTGDGLPVLKVLKVLLRPSLQNSDDDRFVSYHS